MNTLTTASLLSSRHKAVFNWKAARFAKKQSVELVRRLFFALALLLMLPALGVALSDTSNPFERAQIAQRSEQGQHAVVAETEELSFQGSVVGVLLPTIN